MKMIRTWSVWFLLLIPMLCIAEVPNYDIRKAQRDGISLVGMECHHKNMTLEIGLFFPDNPPVRRMDLWNISDLVKFDPATYFLQTVETVARKCNIGSDHYKILFSGLPGANNAMWMCGAVTGVHVSVWKDGAMIFDEDIYRCNRDDYISQVRFRHGVTAPEVERRN